MSEFVLNNIAVISFVGLVLILFGFAALMAAERQRAQILHRLNRYDAGENWSDARSSAQTGSLVYWAGRLRGVVTQVGERLAVFLGGEAEETAAKLAVAGFRSRDALLLFAFAKTVLPVFTFVAGLLWLLLTRTIDLTLMGPVTLVIGAAFGISKAVDMYVDAKQKGAA